LRSIGFAISRIGASPSSDSVTNRSISHRPAEPGEVSAGPGSGSIKHSWLLEIKHQVHARHIDPLTV
jgi:hypothetical protein